MPKKPDVFKLNFQKLNLPPLESAAFKSKILEDIRKNAIDKRFANADTAAGFDLDFDLSFDLSA